MAPKRASGSKRQRGESSNPPSHEPTLESHEGYEAFIEMQLKKIVPERDIASDPPFDAYFTSKSWKKFIGIKTTLFSANRTIVQQFYALLAAAPMLQDHVTIQGKRVDFTPKVINQVFELPNYSKDEYTAMLQQPLDIRTFTKTMLGVEKNLTADWKVLKRQELTHEARFANQLVSSRLMPCIVNDLVTRKRALLIYAILQNMTIDVGRIICSEIQEAANSGLKRRSLGFPYLITRLCRNRQVFGEPIPSEEIPMKKRLEMKDIDKGKGRTANEEEGEEEEDPIFNEPEPQDDPMRLLSDRMERMQAEVHTLRDDVQAFQNTTMDNMRYQNACLQYIMGGQQGSPPQYPLPCDLPPP